MSKAKLVKDLLKTKKESVMGKLGDSPYDDPMEPWSAKYNAPIRNEETFKVGDRVRHEDGTLGTVTVATDKHGFVQWKHAAGKNRVSDKSALRPAGDEVPRWRRKVQEESEQLEEDSWLFSYIKSLGYNPKIMSFAQRSKYARSNAFKHYKQSHIDRGTVPQAASESTDMCNVCGQTPCNCTHLNEISDKKLQDYRYQAHSQIQHYKHAGGKDKPEASKVLAKREPGMARATAKVIQKQKERIAKAPKREPEKVVDKYPLGGYDPASNRSYSESVESLDEAGTGLLMTYIKAKGLNPLTMDGNKKHAYARSSEFKIFKQKHASVKKEEFERLLKAYGAENLVELVMQIQETSGMGERGDDWNEETVDGEQIKNKKKKIKEEADKADTVTMDIPLLIRVLEYAREDAKTDMDLHKVVENLIKMRDEGILSMAQYDAIVKISEEIERLSELKASTYGSYLDKVTDPKIASTRGKTQTGTLKSIKAIGGVAKAIGKKAKAELKELKKIPDNMDADDHLTREDLRQWFSKTHPEGDWKRIDSKGEVAGPCAREPGEPKPKCMSKEKRAKLSKAERAAAVAAKRKHDPVADRPGKGGKPINVSNFGKGKLSEEPVDEACWDTHKKVGMKMKGGKMVPDCRPKNEEVEHLEEKNKPTNPALWSRAKSLARSKFDVYPSAYANGWASKWYKSKGGGWKSVKEESESIQEGLGNVEDSPMSATNSVKAMESSHRAKQMKSARMIKSLYKNKIKETMYDWEKDDKPNAKIVVKGGTTMTGQPRDVVEIEPVLRTRPNQQKPTV